MKIGKKLRITTRLDHAYILPNFFNLFPICQVYLIFGKLYSFMQINLLYQDLLRKREEIKNLEMKGKHKYEYDSDEECDGGGLSLICLKIQMNKYVLPPVITFFCVFRNMGTQTKICRNGSH